MQPKRKLALVLFFGLFTFAVLDCGPGKNAAGGKKVLVLGIDGMDPVLLSQYVREGKLPNFKALIQRGSFQPLGTSIPPQSPVAWSNLITGLNPGGHGIFDFIHRDPKTLLPVLSTSRVEPSKHILALGNWAFPLTSGAARLLRDGKAFWEFLNEHRIPATIFRMPANFPPVSADSRSLAGMGTPDMLGTYGVFSFYTDDPLEPAGTRSGGRVYAVEARDLRISATLYGPYNTFRKGAPQAAVDFNVWLDAIEPVAKIAIQDEELLLQEGEWSDWVRVRFKLIPGLESVAGICRFYLKHVRPYFQLYVTPVNIDPSEPALPISTPGSYARELSKNLGLFYTQGIPEDTKALIDGVFDDNDFLAQSRLVTEEQMRAFDFELNRFREGLFFFYFSGVDQNSHMFWRAIDKNQPVYTSSVAAHFSGVLADFYQEMDRAVGKALARLDAQSTLVVLSDHGFAPFNRSFNLNDWLLENGYVTLKSGGRRSGGDIFSDVDWGRTRAYGLGLNALYLNLKGRERDGIVAPGTDARSLIAEIVNKLLSVRDPVSGQTPITRVDRASEAYAGPHAAEAPDLIIGYNRGYRAGWGTALGQFSDTVLDDNTQPWSGDHCMDYTLVPGVLLSNKAITAGRPSLIDVAPTLLAEFGIAKPASMAGRVILGSQRPEIR